MPTVAELEAQLRAADAENLRLNGELATANEELASLRTAVAIHDEDRAKRYYDGLGDE